jgi:hypothetical protein
MAFACLYPYFILALVLHGAREGLEPSLQAFAASMTEQHMHSTLFTTISIIDTIAKVLGGESWPLRSHFATRVDRLTASAFSYLRWVIRSSVILSRAADPLTDPICNLVVFELDFVLLHDC